MQGAPPSGGGGDPFGKVWAGQSQLDQLSKDNPNYGRPPQGSKTEQRGVAAHNLITGEVLELCQIIYQHGQTSEDGQIYIFFGELFQIYTRISNKLVGMLVRGRRQGLLNFEGETLFQGQDDNVMVVLQRSPVEIEWEMKNPEEAQAEREKKLQAEEDRKQYEFLRHRHLEAAKASGGNGNGKPRKK